MCRPPAAAREGRLRLERFTPAPESTPDEPSVVAIVIPTYKARDTIERVVRRALAVGDLVVVVDDADPDRSAELVRGIDPRVHVVSHDVNRGVGGATKTGMHEAIALGARYIVKIDSDDQMDTSYVPFMIETLERYPEVDLVKGNRFADPATLRRMPFLRLIGNASATLLVKFSSGYWSIVDPTNGFLATRREVILNTDLDALADRYFFETDLLCAFGLRRRVVAEVEMPAIYSDEPPGPWGLRTLLPFPIKLTQRFFRRLLLNYLIVEINVGSLCALIGFPLLAFAVAFGWHEWSGSLSSQIPRPSGTIVLALLLFMIGFQLSLQALLYDVQFSTPTVKLRRERAGRGADRALQRR
jgi:glycosyltransferase involved in cell wall biosynthesis